MAVQAKISISNGGHSTSIHAKLSMMAVVLVVSLAMMYLYVPFPSYKSWNIGWSNDQSKPVGTIIPPHSDKSSTGLMASVSSPVGVTIEDRLAGGIGIRLYKPRTTSSYLHPGLVYFHGGGWVAGSPRKYDNIMEAIAREMNIVIVSVDYRKIPQVMFPWPFYDCLKATKYVLSNSTEFGMDPKRIGILGDSAGGNLAAAVVLKLRDEHFSPMPKVQVLVYPCLQAHDFLLPSYVQNRKGHKLTKIKMAYYWSMYATGQDKLTGLFMRNSHTTSAVKHQVYESYIHHEDLGQEYLYEPYKKPPMDYGNESVWDGIKGTLTSPYFAPLMAADLTNVPQTYVYTAQLDVLRDEGLLFVKRLNKSGVNVTHVHSKQGKHGIFSRFSDSEQGRECMDSVIKYIKKSL